MLMRSVQGGVACSVVTGDHVVTVEARRFGLLQVFCPWALLSGYVDHTPFLEFTDPVDVIVRQRDTGEVIFRKGLYASVDA